MVETWNPIGRALERIRRFWSRSSCLFHDLKNKSNCLIFALILWRHLDANGKEAYLITRRSRLANGPHFLVGVMRKNGLMRVVSYVPYDPREKALPPPMFYGFVKWGDEDSHG